MRTGKNALEQLAPMSRLSSPETRKVTTVLHFETILSLGTLKITTDLRLEHLEPQKSRHFYIFAPKAMRTKNKYAPKQLSRNRF